MKYMLMMHVPGGASYQIAGWPAADIAAHIAFMRNFAAKLHAAGELVWAEGLSGPEQAKLVRAGADGEPITDGAFPDTKEFLAGYWVVMSTRRSVPTRLLPKRPQRLVRAAGR